MKFVTAVLWCGFLQVESVDAIELSSGPESENTLASKPIAISREGLWELAGRGLPGLAVKDTEHRLWGRRVRTVLVELSCQPLSRSGSPVWE